MDNRLVIAGVVAEAPDTRYSPGGVPIARFTLRHQSEQAEAGVTRRVECELGVVASGEALQPAVKGLRPEQRVRVEGYLNRAHRRRPDRVVLHARTIELL